MTEVPDLAPPIAADLLGPRIERGRTPFAVVDVETTGLAPGRGHRIVEIAIVRCRADGSVEDFWHTLLDPGRDVGPSHVHGLSMLDVLGAPTFADVAGDVVERLRDRVLVAHNVPFDLGFLEAEFARTGEALPELPTLCTLALTGQKLRAACAAESIPLDNAHSAREDALATAALLRTQLAGTPSDFAELGVGNLVLPTRWPTMAASGRTQPRALPAERRPDVRSEWGSAGETAYATALERALDDGEVDSLELDHLVKVAREWSLGPEAVESVGAQLTADIDLAVKDRLDVVTRTIRAVGS